MALPEWFFSKDKQTAPLILLVLLFGGIVTPLGIAAWYLMGTQKWVLQGGPGGEQGAQGELDGHGGVAAHRGTHSAACLTTIGSAERQALMQAALLQACLALGTQQGHFAGLFPAGLWGPTS